VFTVKEYANLPGVAPIMHNKRFSKRVDLVRVTRVTRMAYSPSLWLMAIGW
jgi:hypothetical protein